MQVRAQMDRDAVKLKEQEAATRGMAISGNSIIASANDMRDECARERKRAEHAEARLAELNRQLKTMVELWEWCHPPNSTAVIAAIAEAKAILTPPDDCPHCRGTGRICRVCLSSEESCQCPTFSEGEDCVCRL
jgi:hypothetical protein